MARTHEKVRYPLKGKVNKLIPTSAAQGVEDILTKQVKQDDQLPATFENLGNVLRFSDLERATPAISVSIVRRKR